MSTPKTSIKRSVVQQPTQILEILWNGRTLQMWADVGGVAAQNGMLGVRLLGGSSGQVTRTAPAHPTAKEKPNCSRIMNRG